MRLFVFGGVALAVQFAVAPAISQTAPASSAPPTRPARHSFFTSDQKRSDIAAHVERIFKPLDLNQDGFVTKDEIATSEARFEERLSKSAPKRAAKMFARFDADHDGRITEAEFDAVHKTHPGAKANRRPTSLFVRADANKDGIVTRAEFDGATASGKIKLRHANMRGSALVRLFDTADSNRDGRLSLEEAREGALQQFDAADFNHDGVLTPDERRQASKTVRAKHRTT